MVSYIGQRVLTAGIQNAFCQFDITLAARRRAALGWIGRKGQADHQGADNSDQVPPW